MYIGIFHGKIRGVGTLLTARQNWDWPDVHDTLKILNWQSFSNKKGPFRK